MKRKSDPRHLKRTQLVKDLFAFSFNKLKKPPASIQDIVASLSKIDKLIAKSAPSRPIEQINKIDLAILRLSFFELIIKREEPLKVIIDEAVELGKQFGGDSSPSFINGALGKIVSLQKL